MGKYDNLRAEFIAGKMSLREIAAKHGAKYETLRQAACRESWSRRRQEWAQRVADDARQAATEAAVAWCEADRAAAEKLREAVQKRLENADSLSMQELREAGKTLSEAHAIGRAALGMAGELLPTAPRYAGARDALDELIRGDDVPNEIRAELRARAMPEHMAGAVQCHLSDEDVGELCKGRGADAICEAIAAAIGGD